MLAERHRKRTHLREWRGCREDEGEENKKKKEEEEETSSIHLSALVQDM